MDAEPLRTVTAVLSRFDTTFSAFMTAFHNGEYVLWLGSGISRDKVPNVNDLLGHVIELLRSNIDMGQAACVYRAALSEVLDLAGLTDGELGTIDFSTGFDAWPLKKRILGVLVTQYSKVLDVVVGDKNAEDYLVWTGLDVPNTYGSPEIDPDIEHYCIAILMLEGLIPSAVTANWDGLLEKAINELTPAFGAIGRVVVTPEDFRQQNKQIEVIKFHGCAVRARDDEETYRPLLIARESQISVWTAQQRNQSMRKHLEILYTDHPTLMIGLSAQDANLQTVFATAIQDLARPWPTQTPAVVLSEEELHAHHRNLLRLTYGANHQINAAEIARSALIGSYGKPTLLALVLASLTEKLTYLMEHVLSTHWDEEERRRLRGDLLFLRDEAAGVVDLDKAAFLELLIDAVDLALSVFRAGSVEVLDKRRYEPISDRPVKQAIHSPYFPSRALGWLAVALSMVGRGRTLGYWTVVTGDRKSPEQGVLRLITDQRQTRVFFVKDSATRARLEMEHNIDSSDGNVLIIEADEGPPESARSPRVRFGRNGKVRPGTFSVEASIAEVASGDELYEAFKLAGGF